MPATSKGKSYASALGAGLGHEPKEGGVRKEAELLTCVAERGESNKGKGIESWKSSWRI